MKVKDLIRKLEQTGLNNEVRFLGNKEDNCIENLYLSFDDVGDVLIYKDMDIKWTCTDIDNGQYGRQLGKNVFEFKEKGIQMAINLCNYTNKEIKNHITAYYSTIKELKKLSKKSSNWIIAECIFEQESGLY